MNHTEQKNGDVMFVYTKFAEGTRIQVRVGTAWLRVDGSIHVQLDALPVTGELTIRSPKTDE